MGYRHIIVKRCLKLSLKNNSLQILKDDTEDPLSIPLEDISSVLIEDPKTVITSRIITELAKNGIMCCLCNEKYIPAAQILPLNMHYNQLGIYNKQISLDEKTKNRLWQKNIKKKIENQAIVQSFTKNDDRVFNMLIDYSNNVKENDCDNKEGIASKVHFTSLFGKEFIRNEDTPISNALDYGYTIIHSDIVRYLTLYGLNTYLGIWHCSEQNAHNLASDLIESYRPLVDYFCYWNYSDIEYPLSSKNRIHLIELLKKEVMINNMRCTVDYSIEVMVKSYLRVLQNKDIDSLLLPTIIGIDFINEEFI